MSGMIIKWNGGMSDNARCRSDGYWAEWKAGRELVLKIWPDDELVCPWV